jgi:hypothetical protein
MATGAEATRAASRSASPSAIASSLVKRVLEAQAEQLLLIGQHLQQLVVRH